MRIDPERVGAGLAVALGGGYLGGALSIPDVSIGDPLGPRAFPLFIGGLMSLLGCSILFRPGSGVSFKGMSVSTVGLLLLLGFYGYGIPVLGYPIATFAFLVISSKLLGERRILRGLVISGGVSGAIFLLFTKVLEIPLPLGLLGALKG